MSLADVLAVSAGAKSLVLLGDPQQLEQPQQASHPPGAAASALEHLLGGTKTIAADRGLFLHQTRRLHPDICRFTAEAFYENRLTSVPGLERQAVLAPAGSAAAALGSAGLVYVPVEHDANQSRSSEEVDAVADARRGADRRRRSLPQRGRRGGAADERGPHDRRAVQRPGHGARGAIARRAHRHRRQVPRPASAGRHRVVDDVHARGRAARHGLSLQRESLERRDVAREGAVHSRRQPAAVRARLPHAAADAARERVLPYRELARDV